MIQRWETEAEYASFAHTNEGRWCRSEDVAALEAEVARLEAKLESKELDWAELYCAKMDENARLQASLAALREAARPFCPNKEWVDHYKDCPSSHKRFRNHPVGHLRALARAMEDSAA